MHIRWCVLLLHHCRHCYLLLGYVSLRLRLGLGLGHGFLCLLYPDILTNLSRVLRVESLLWSLTSPCSLPSLLISRSSAVLLIPLSWGWLGIEWDLTEHHQHGWDLPVPSFLQIAILSAHNHILIELGTCGLDELTLDPVNDIWDPLGHIAQSLDHHLLVSSLKQEPHSSPHISHSVALHWNPNFILRKSWGYTTSLPFLILSLGLVEVGYRSSGLTSNVASWCSVGHGRLMLSEVIWSHLRPGVAVCSPLPSMVLAGSLSISGISLPIIGSWGLCSLWVVWSALVASPVGLPLLLLRWVVLVEDLGGMVVMGGVRERWVVLKGFLDQRLCLICFNAEWLSWGLILCLVVHQKIRV